MLNFFIITGSHRARFFFLEITCAPSLEDSAFKDVRSQMYELIKVVQTINAFGTYEYCMLRRRFEACNSVIKEYCNFMATK